jgi:hypothetical protein
MLKQTLKRLRLLWRALSGRSTLERDMDDELRFHMESRATDLARSGVSPADATRRANAPPTAETVTGGAPNVWPGICNPGIGVFRRSLRLHVVLAASQQSPSQERPCSL